MLSDSQYIKLVEDYGEDTVKYYIDLVDERVQANGNKHKYKDWDLKIRQAIRDNWGGNPNSSSSKQSTVPTDKQSLYDEYNEPF